MPLAPLSAWLHGQRDKGVVEVQRRLLAMVAVCAAVLAGCSSSGDDAVSSSGDTGAADVEIRVEMGSATSAFTASGAAVDDGLLCAAGQTLPGGEVQTVDGEPSSDEEFGQAFDEALATEGVVERVFFVEFGCADAEGFSGTFTMQQNVRMDFSEIDAAAFQAGELDQVPGGTWEIAEGTGDFADLTGGGDHSMDFTTEEIAFTGELTSG